MPVPSPAYPEDLCLALVSSPMLSEGYGAVEGAAGEMAAALIAALSVPREDSLGFSCVRFRCMLSPTCRYCPMQRS